MSAAPCLPSLGEPCGSCHRCTSFTEVEARARAVVIHWREQAQRTRDEQAELDKHTGPESPSFVFYVPATDALDRAADRLEAALDGRDFA